VNEAGEGSGRRWLVGIFVTILTGAFVPIVIALINRAADPSPPPTTSPVTAGAAESAKSAQRSQVVATDCIRPLVNDPNSYSNGTRISALLNGEWPENVTIYAEVQFVGSDYGLHTYSSPGESVNVLDSGALVSAAKVWVTGSASSIQCNLWVRQP
jgi:hypothetical protein